MNSYVIYRMAETIRVIAFMTLSILVFNFYPVTAVMIVLLAILNDGAILTIAVDNTKPAARPVAWNMPVVLGMATVLGTAGVLASFGLFYLGEVVWKLDRPTIQTLIYLKLSVAGHMTMFVTRTRGPFWSIKPAPALLGAILGTQAVATLIAVYGLGLVTPIGWRWAAVVWGYALAWFLVNDRVKLAAYRLSTASRRCSASATWSAGRPLVGLEEGTAEISAPRPVPRPGYRPRLLGQVSPSHSALATASGARFPRPGTRPGRCG